MIGPVPLTINAHLANVAGAEAKFDRELERRSAREVGNASSNDNSAGHPTGLVASEGLSEALESRLDLSMHHPEDLRYAARVLRAKFPDDPDMAVLAGHIEAWSMANDEEQFEEAVRDMGTIRSRAMMERLASDGIPVKADMGGSGNVGRGSRAGVAHEPQAGPRTTAPLGFPAQTTAEPMSGRLRSMAGQIRRLAGLAGTVRQKNRLMQRASELERMAVRSYEREGAADDAEFTSFDSWSDEDRPGSVADIQDQVDGQRELPDVPRLDEDVPGGRVPQPGSRVRDPLEDQLGDPAAGTDEPQGLRRNLADDDVLQRVRRGTAKFDAGQPRGDDRYGHKVRYSGLRQSMRESGGLTRWLIGELDLWDRVSRSS